MKKLIMMLMASCATLFAVADEEISMVEKEITSIAVPFGIRGYTPSNKDVVRVEKTSETALRITALKRGRCDLEVRGDMDMTQRYQIVVGDDTARVKQNLDRELERMPEVHTSIIGDSIRIDGEVKTFQREKICENLEWLGAKMDHEANEKYCGEDGIISTPDSTTKLVVVTTNEELVIATDTYNLL